jgi:hypothetical protein
MTAYGALGAKANPGGLKGTASDVTQGTCVPKLTECVEYPLDIQTYAVSYQWLEHSHCQDIITYLGQHPPPTKL